MDRQRTANNTLHLLSLGYEVFSHRGEEDMAEIITYVL